MSASSQPVLLALHDVGVTTPSGEKILEHISLELSAREIVSLIGPNGAGKSTLIRVILKLVKPSYGRVSYQSHLRIGYVPQKINWAGSIPYRVEDFIRQTAARAPAHLSRSQQEEHARQILDETGVYSLRKRSIHHLSGGERQRVLIARALLGYPELLILDEPMQGLDLHSEETLYAYLQTLPARYGCAIFIVSHDIHWVMQGTERVICLNHHICCSGTPQQVQEDLAYQSLFGSRLFYQHQHQHCLHQKHGNLVTAPYAPLTPPGHFPATTTRFSPHRNDSSC